MALFRSSRAFHFLRLSSSFCVLDQYDSIHALQQNNVLGTEMWETREELPIEIVTWIERTYRRRRRERSLGWMTPVEFEAVFRALDEVDVAS